MDKTSRNRLIPGEGLRKNGDLYILKYHKNHLCWHWYRDGKLVEAPLGGMSDLIENYIKNGYTIYNGFKEYYNEVTGRG